MRRSWLRVALLLTLALVGAGISAGTSWSGRLRAQTEPPLTIDDLLNLNYPSDFPAAGVAPLDDGVYLEEILAGSASRIVITLGLTQFGEFAGQPAALAVLQESGGGSGTFLTLHLVQRVAGVPTVVAHGLLGDRVSVDRIDFRADRIRVELIGFGPDDPFCCPQQRFVRDYAVEGDAVVLVDDAAGLRVSPTGGWVLGANGVVAVNPDGVAPAAEAARAIAAASHRRVARIWMLAGGAWRLFVPNSAIDFGLREIPGTAALFVVLERPTLGVGAAGPYVQEAIDRLIALGYLAPDAAPAVAAFTDAVRLAVVAFQRDQQLVPDGQVDPATWAALDDPAPPPPDVEEPGTGLAPDAEDPTGAAVVYLTFDDGPIQPYTSEVMRLLDEFDAKATFFVLGEHVADSPALVEALHTAGHSVQNHTFSHHTLDEATRQEFLAEVDRTADLIADTIGVRPTCLRPPYGATDATTVALAQDTGHTVVLWDVDPQDWTRPGSGVIAAHVLEHVHAGSIVLLHDEGGERSQTVSALAAILPALQSRGSRFAALCE